MIYFKVLWKFIVHFFRRFLSFIGRETEDDIAQNKLLSENIYIFRWTDEANSTERKFAGIYEWPWTFRPVTGLDVTRGWGMGPRKHSSTMLIRSQMSLLSVCRWQARIINASKIHHCDSGNLHLPWNPLVRCLSFSLMDALDLWPWTAVMENNSFHKKHFWTLDENSTNNASG